MSVLLDSVILIDHLNGILPAREYIESLNQPRISVITRAEVLSGTGPADAKRVKYLLDQFPALEINQTVADLAAGALPAPAISAAPTTRAPGRSANSG